MTLEQIKEIGSHINSVFQNIYLDCNGYDVEEMWDAVLDILYDRAPFSSSQVRHLFLSTPDEILREHFWKGFKSEYEYYFS